MVCSDTNLLVGLLRGDANAIAKVKALEGMNLRLTVTPITSCELFKGAYRSGNQNNIEIVRDLLENLKLLEFNNHCAQNFGRVTEELKKKGTPIGELDAIIGAICLTHGEALVTRDMKHLGKIDGLILQDW